MSRVTRWTDGEYQALMERRDYRLRILRQVGRDLHETKEFMPAVIALAKRCGWKVYHTHDSRGSDPGFPDLVMKRKGRLIHAELKSAKGVVTPEQNEWLVALAEEPKLTEVYLWRPDAWFDGTIEDILR